MNIMIWCDKWIVIITVNASYFYFCLGIKLDIVSKEFG